MTHSDFLNYADWRDKIESDIRVFLVEKLKIPNDQFYFSFGRRINRKKNNTPYYTGNLLLENLSTDKFNKLQKLLKTLDFIVDLEVKVSYFENPTLIVSKKVTFRYLSYSELLIKRLNYLISSSDSSTNLK